MAGQDRRPEVPDGWNWFETDVGQETTGDDDLVRCFARCFKDNDGETVLNHLRQTVLDRRLGPNASDAELRHLEGQRSLAAHIQSMVHRGKS